MKRLLTVFVVMAVMAAMAAAMAVPAFAGVPAGKANFQGFISSNAPAGPGKARDCVAKGNQGLYGAARSGQAQTPNDPDRPDNFLNLCP